MVPAKHFVLSFEGLEKTMENAIGITMGGPTASVLQRHIPIVTRAITKAVRKVDDLDSIVDYLKVVGTLHVQHGIQVSLQGGN